MYVKVCGITQLDDAWSAIEAGADALGFNFVPTSKRRIEVEQARAIIEQVRGRVLSVAVVADLTPEAALELQRATGVDRLQLHGAETRAQFSAFGPRAFKALRIGDASDVEHARIFPGHPVLVDAKVEGHLGGTGHSIDWPLVVSLARQRALILAGGLTAENVERAVQSVQPWGVDTASGVETDGDPRRKDPEKMRRFVAAARRPASAAQGLPF
jgi:phosphoribosylanthranilate isomerase